MKSIHLSPIYNRQSILKNGIIPTKIKIPSHSEAFRDISIDDNIIYSWADGHSNEQYIKDMIYCLIYISKKSFL